MCFFVFLLFFLFSLFLYLFRHLNRVYTKHMCLHCMADMPPLYTAAQYTNSNIYVCVSSLISFALADDISYM